MPILTVSAPVADRSLVALATVKAELGITDTASDALLTQWIKDDSDAVCEACGVATDQVGRRTFLTEAVSIAYRASEVPCRGLDPAPLILPWRIPFTVSAVTEDGTALTVATDVECEPMSGLLWRLDSDGERTHWTRGRITITGSAGWALADVPAALRRAVIECVTIRWDGKDINSYTKAEETTGAFREEFWTGNLPGMQGSVPAPVLDGLRSAGLVNVAIG